MNVDEPIALDSFDAKNGCITSSWIPEETCVPNSMCQQFQWICLASLLCNEIQKAKNLGAGLQNECVITAYV